MEGRSIPKHHHRPALATDAAAVAIPLHNSCTLCFKKYISAWHWLWFSCQLFQISGFTKFIPINGSYIEQGVSSEAIAVFAKQLNFTYDMIFMALRMMIYIFVFTALDYVGNKTKLYYYCLYFRYTAKLSFVAGRPQANGSWNGIIGWLLDAVGFLLSLILYFILI